VRPRVQTLVFPKKKKRKKIIFFPKKNLIRTISDSKGRKYWYVLKVAKERNREEIQI
jgi:hypothetical protein